MIKQLLETTLKNSGVDMSQYELQSEELSEENAFRSGGNSDLVYFTAVCFTHKLSDAMLFIEELQFDESDQTFLFEDSVMLWIGTQCEIDDSFILQPGQAPLPTQDLKELKKILKDDFSIDVGDYKVSSKDASGIELKKKGGFSRIEFMYDDGGTTCVDLWPRD